MQPTKQGTENGRVCATNVALKSYYEMNKSVRWRGCGRIEYENVGGIDIEDNLILRW
jgi:hypothetical protein